MGCEGPKNWQPVNSKVFSGLKLDHLWMLTMKLQQWQWVETVVHIGVQKYFIDTLPDLTLLTGLRALRNLSSNGSTGKNGLLVSILYFLKNI